VPPFPRYFVVALRRAPEIVRATLRATRALLRALETMVVSVWAHTPQYGPTMVCIEEREGGCIVCWAGLKNEQPPRTSTLAHISHVSLHLHLLLARARVNGRLDLACREKKRQCTATRQLIFALVFQIFVETEGQKRIIVGMIKDLGIRSRREIGKFLDKEVHLFLKVKVKKWTDDSPVMYEKMGLEFNA